MSRRIVDLPDYAALKKLGAALWQQDSSYHGAAVMVGAGFSRCSASSGDINSKLPLWGDLSKVLSGELKSSSFADPLRLAEEYCAYFGKQALHDLVKNEINDVAWTPGEQYKELLGLPWSEVLTTNWDTLLERASLEVHQPVYNIVVRQEDLSSARSPRIVKLHGTVGITDDLVFTQEDYRKYPQRHAAFVNFARQVFIENELCLIGFSGDDPNFLQWAGWVRDQLTVHARRIYLVGALNLTAAKRKYLESLNVAPIDLGDLVAEYDDHDLKHSIAVGEFLLALQSLKPKQAWEWSPSDLQQNNRSGEGFEKVNSDPVCAARLLESYIPVLEADRKSYPGWLVCPSKQRWELQTQIRAPFPTPMRIAEMGVESRHKLLYEISWRYGVTYEAIPSWLVQELLKICDPATPCVLTKKQQMEVALVLLKNTRWMDASESETIDSIVTCTLETHVKHWPESEQELVYHKAIVARDRFDYPLLESLVERIRAHDPVWRLRKASLLSELGRFEEGGSLIAEAHRLLLDQYRNDRNSIFVFSRLAWAHWLSRAVDMWRPGVPFNAFPSVYQESKCNPWDHIEHIKDQVSKALDRQVKQQGVEPLFEPGRYKDNSRTVSFNNELHPLLLLEGISCSAGIPLRWDGVSFLVESGGRLAEVEELDGVHRFSLAIRAASTETSDVLKRVFSRTNIAKLSQEEINYLRGQCTQAITYWCTVLANGRNISDIYAIGRLRIFIEVLARVSVRVTPDQAKSIFIFGASLGKNTRLHHVWLFDALRNLLNYTLKSIPESAHYELLAEALMFPLQCEIKYKDHPEWPNPIVRIPGVRPQNAALDRRIDEIIDLVAPCSRLSAPALLRLLPLIRGDFLSESERRKIANKVWGDAPAYQSLPETGLLKYLLLELPSQDEKEVSCIVRRYLFEAQLESLCTPSLLMDINSAAHAVGVKAYPSESQAIEYFAHLVRWRPEIGDRDIFGATDQIERQTAELIGSVLSHSVVPSLPESYLTQENFDGLCEFYAEVGASEVMTSLVYFANQSEEIAGRIERLIGQGLQDPNSTKVANAAHALLRWRDLNDSPRTSRLVSRLIYLIGWNRINGLSAILWTANKMYLKGYLSPADLQSVIDVLPIIFDSTDYSSITASSREAISVSLVRAACVRLARDIQNGSSGHVGELCRILEEAKLDALPEVRFADLVEV